MVQHAFLIPSINYSIYFASLTQQVITTIYIVIRMHRVRDIIIIMPNKLIGMDTLVNTLRFAAVYKVYMATI